MVTTTRNMPTNTIVTENMDSGERRYSGSNKKVSPNLLQPIFSRKGWRSGHDLHCLTLSCKMLPKRADIAMLGWLEERQINR